MAIKGGKTERLIQNRLLRPLRLKAILNILNKLPSGTILDVGCMDDYILKRLSKKFDYFGIDDEPLIENEKIKRLSIEKLGNERYDVREIRDFSEHPKNQTNKHKGFFDIVIATEVLEHLDNPVEAMKKLKSLTKRFLLVSVPNEPFFSLFRFFMPAREHLWTIYPWTLRKYLGKPILEKKACFRRTYIALWNFKNP